MVALFDILLISFLVTYVVISDVCVCVCVCLLLYPVRVMDRARLGIHDISR